MHVIEETTPEQLACGQRRFVLQQAHGLRVILEVRQEGEPLEIEGETAHQPPQPLRDPVLNHAITAACIQLAARTVRWPSYVHLPPTP